MRAIDADTTKAGDQKFEWIGTKEFSGRGVGGELRYFYDNDPRVTGTVIQGDVTGDGRADFEIEISTNVGETIFGGNALIDESDFLL